MKNNIVYGVALLLLSCGNGKGEKINKEPDNMRGFDPASEDDMDDKQVDIEFSEVSTLLQEKGKLSIEWMRDEFGYCEIIIQRLRQDPDIQINKESICLMSKCSASNQIRIHVSKKPRHIEENNSVNKDQNPSLELAVKDALYRINTTFQTPCVKWNKEHG